MNTSDPAGPEIQAGLRNALDNDAVWAEPPADLQADALAALRAARSAATPAPSATRPASDGSADGPRPVADIRSRRRRAWLLSAAAATVFVGALTRALVIDVPDSSLALTGTDLAPAAAAKAGITETASGFEVLLDIDDLAPAKEGTYYQAWFTDGNGMSVTIGTFHARESGQDIVLWSGADPADYSFLTVTLQQVGEGAESSGRVVLTGRLSER
ncbi:MAG: anti-sigma factor [Nocardioides sp.]